MTTTLCDGIRAMDAEREPQTFTLPVVWTGVENTPVLAANQFIGQAADGEIFLAFGLFTPPPIVGPPDQQEAQVRRLDRVPVQCLARLSMNRRRLEELIEVLQRTLEIEAKTRNVRSDPAREGDR
jgi:hypothetical protein